MDELRGYTPGPWLVHRDDEGIHVYAKRDEDWADEFGWWVAQMYENMGEGNPTDNAALIATAPNLAAALRDLLAWANIQDHHSEQAVQVRDNAQRALALAQGREQEGE